MRFWCKTCEVLVLVEEIEEHNRRHHGHHKKPRADRHLRQTFITHIRSSDMNKYHLSWSPGVGVKRDVIQLLPDKTEKNLASMTDLTVSSVDVDFADDEPVEWFTRDTGADGAVKESDHNTFTAKDETPASADTNLNATFVSHTPTP